MGRDQREVLNGWQVACYVLAVPLVYWFAQYFYEAILVVSWALTSSIGIAGEATGKGLRGFFDDMGRDAGLVGRLLLVPVALVAVVIWLILALIWGLILLVFGVVAWTALWLVRSPGPPRYFLFPILVWFVGTFLYGTVFPLLWRVVEPALANTLGEMAFQRARERVFGIRPRYGQPLYLAVAAVTLLAGGLRILAPVLWMTDAEWGALVATVLSYQH